MKVTKIFTMLRLLCAAALLMGILPAQAQSACQSRAFSSHEERVSAAYIAYYGRPADTGGLSYWAGQMTAQGGNLGAIIDAFGNSAEYRQRFGNLSNRELIRNLYQQLYGRDPDMAGWAFYEMWLDTGVQSLASIAISIMDGTQGGDTAILDNRKTVARHFITRMEALGAAAPAITDGSLLADLMAATDGSAASRENACAQVNTLIEAQSTTTTVLTMAAHEAGASGAINNLSGAVGSERFFKLMVPAGVTDLVIRTARTAGGMGDVDLYVSRGVRPAPGNADCSSGAWFSADEQCSFATPVAGEYFILLRGAIVDYSGVTLSASWRGSGPPPEIEILTGFFRDSAVKGLDYASCPVPLNPAACITGQTGADGEYEYRNGDRVRFTLGQLVVAQAAAAPLHTPTTISKSQDEATKLAQFLQSIDENSDPKDGIHISPETRARAQNSALVQQGQTDFSLNLNRIPNMVSVLTPGRAVVGPTEAQAHAEASQRLLAMSVTDVGQWILGKKQLPSSSNVGVLSTSARERLRLAMWYRVKGNLQARADGLSNNVDDLERKKNQRAAYVDLTQSLVEAGLLMGNVKGMENMNIDELTIEIINNHISIATATLKVADIDIESYSDTTKGILNAVGGKWSGALKDGAKGGAGFIFSSEPVNKSIAEFFISDLFGTFIDVADDCLPYVKGNKCALGTIKAKIITGQSAKAIKAVNDLYASYQLFSNDIHLTTYIAAIDYLNNYYLQAGDQQRLADIYGVNADPYTMVWMSKKFSSMMDQLLFENLVAETKSSVEQLYAIYSDALGASNADTYAQVDGIGDIVCNGTEDTLRLALFSQHPWFRNRVPMNIDNSFTTQRIDWNWAHGVSLTVLADGRSAKVIFDEVGYKAIVASAFGRYNDARTVAIGMRPVHVKSCVVPNKDIVGGRWEFAGFSADGSGANYRAVPHPGYEFVHWVDSNGQTASAVLAKYFHVASVQEADVARPVFRPISVVIAAPTLSMAQEGNGLVKISWSAVQGAQAYEVFVSTTPNINPADPASYIKKSTYNFADYVVTIDGLINGKTYYFVTWAIADSHTSSLSNMVHATPKTDDPLVLNLNLQATPGDGYVNLSWNAIPGATEYMLHMAAGAGGPDGLPSIGTTTANQYRVSGLQNGTLYRFTAKAFKGGQVIAGSGLVSATPVGGQLIAGRYLPIEGGAVIRDTVNGLEWQRCSVGQTWNGATQRCDGTAATFNWNQATQLTAAGGFRLPTIDELKTLVYCSSGQPQLFGPLDDEIGCGRSSRPTIVQGAFPNTPSSDVWSDSLGYENAGGWAVDFYLGLSNVRFRIDNYPVRLVRRGQSFAPLPARSASLASVKAASLLAQASPAAHGAALANFTGYDGTPPNAAVQSERRDSTGQGAYFLSRATNLVPGVNNGAQHLFHFDAATGQIKNLAASTSGAPGDGDITAFDVALQAGKLVFRTKATNLESGPGLYLLDLETGTRRPLLTALQHGGSDPGADNPVLGTTGQGLAFDAPDAAGRLQVFTAALGESGLHDLRQETPIDGQSIEACCAALSGDGRYLAWQEVGGDGRVLARVLDLASDKSVTIDWPQEAATGQVLRLALSENGAQLHWLALPDTAENAAPLHGVANPLFVPTERLH